MRNDGTNLDARFFLEQKLSIILLPRSRDDDDGDDANDVDAAEDADDVEAGKVVHDDNSDTAVPIAALFDLVPPTYPVDDVCGQTSLSSSSISVSLTSSIPVSSSSSNTATSDGLFLQNFFGNLIVESDDDDKDGNDDDVARVDDGPSRSFLAPGFAPKERTLTR